jgi:hypothetical protein
MRTAIAILCAFFVLMVCLPQAKADTCTLSYNIVSNCGFETGDFTSWTLTGNDTPGELGNLYGVEGIDPFPLPGGTAPHSGSFQAFFADLNADPTTLSQMLTTTPGEAYTVSFYLAQELVGPGTVNNSVDVTLGGVTVEDLTNVGVQGYTLYTGTVTTTSASSLLSLSFGNDIGEFLVDDVSVATPEPAGWPVAAVCLAAVAWFHRRRIARAAR